MIRDSFSDSVDSMPSDERKRLILALGYSFYLLPIDIKQGSQSGSESLVLHKNHKDVFQKSDIPKTLYKLINSIINGEIEKRISNSINMYEVLSCTYKDGRYMYTYAVVFDNKDSKILSRIKDREWYIKRNTDSIYDIDIPCMTNLERRRISQHLPQTDVETLVNAFPFIPKSDIEKYIPIYRYYPNFIPAENKT